MIKGMDPNVHNLPPGNTLEERLDSPYPYIRIYARIEKNDLEKKNLDDWFMNLPEEERDDEVKEKYDEEYKIWLQEKISIEQWFYTYNRVA
jgi:hypothetical protein